MARVSMEALTTPLQLGDWNMPTSRNGQRSGRAPRVCVSRLACSTYRHCREQFPPRAVLYVTPSRVASSRFSFKGVRLGIAHNTMQARQAVEGARMQKSPGAI